MRNVRFINQSAINSKFAIYEVDRVIYEWLTTLIFIFKNKVRNSELFNDFSLKADHYFCNR